MVMTNGTVYRLITDHIGSVRLGLGVSTGLEARCSVKDKQEIYVRLLDEGVDVWRPVRAQHLQGNVYRIASQPYDVEIESRQFLPGDEVVCELVESSEGSILAAVRKAVD